MKTLIVTLAAVALVVGCESSMKVAADAAAPTSSAVSSDATVPAQGAATDSSHVEDASPAAEASASLLPAVVAPFTSVDGGVSGNADAHKPTASQKK